MSEEIRIDKSVSDEGIYLGLIPQIEALMSENDHYLSNLSNFTAVLNEAFDKISWIGFYLFDGNQLFLGPFQGKLACTKIKMGSGVCGTSAAKRETMVVEDVHKFPGHIACDSGSNSEIVLPLVKEEKLIGVLDLDSYEFSSFNETDKKYLEKFIEILLRKTIL